MAKYPQLQIAAHRLKQAAPHQYVEMIRALDEICHDLHLALVAAEQAAILNVQGRAQQADDLLAAFDPPQSSKPSTAAGP